MPSLAVGSPTKVSYSPIPCGERKTIPFSLPWGNADEYNIDFTSAIQLTTIDSIQSLFVDNLDNANSVTIVCEGTGQRLIVPAASYAFLPAITLGYPKFTITSVSAADQRTYILANNFPVPAQVITP